MRSSRWYFGAALAVAALASAPVASGSITFIAQPGDSAFCGTYDLCANLMPITAADGTSFGLVTDGSVTATLTDALTAGAVGVDWENWNSPPAVESTTPLIGISDGSTETIALSSAVEVFG